MRKGALARNLAHSITLAGWSEDIVEAALIRRLPQALRSEAAPLAVAILEEIPAVYAPSPKVVATYLQDQPGFARVFRYCQRRDVWPAPDLTPPVMSPAGVFADLPLPQLPTVDLLADWLLTPLPRLDHLADLHGRYENHGDTAVNNYHYILKKKRDGGTRVIEAPKANLKAIQRRILDGILDTIQVHDDAFGFVKRRNCLDGTRRHAGERLVVSFDLQNFFPSIGAGRVYGLFRCLGYSHAVSRYLTALCTTATPSRILERLAPGDRTLYRGPHVPQGSPASPAIANRICHALDRRLSMLAARIDANYSRYADDMGFSGDDRIGPVLRRFVPEILKDEGFQPNADKTRSMGMRGRQSVTGVVVNRHLNIRRATFDHLKAVIHACGRPEDPRLNDGRFRASLLGQIDWVETVNPARGARLRALLAKALDRRRGG